MITKYKVFFLFFLFYSVILFLGLNYEWKQIWSHTGINFTSNSYAFGDIRNVTNLLEFEKVGLNPSVDSFINGLGQNIPPFNYPAIWRIFSSFGVDNSSTKYFGITFFILFSVGVFFCIKINRRVDIYFYLLLLFSPVISLLIERGNNDQVVFFFIVLFCVFFSRNQTLSLIFYYASFLTKFFPIVLILTLYEKYEKRTIFKLIAILTPIFIYIIITFPEIYTLGSATPISSPRIGYGWKTYELILGKHLGTDIVNLFALISTILVVPFFFIIQSTKTTLYNSDDKYILMFKSGMIIYIATYFVGTSYDYRLVFLLLTVPFILKKLHSSVLYKIVAISMVFLFWSHQIILTLLNLHNVNYIFVYISFAFLFLKSFLHYLLIYMYIYIYKKNFRINFFGKYL